VSALLTKGTAAGWNVFCSFCRKQVSAWRKTVRNGI